MRRSFYPAKLLLFGEYIIIHGAMALAVPFAHFGGRWEKADIPGDNLSTRRSLEAFGVYLKDNMTKFPSLREFNHDAYQEALESGWHFNSDIPSGYGLGSSGALCAAVYDRFFNNTITGIHNEERPQLKELFGQMESFFHGSSSGVDPLVCYLQKALLIHQKHLDTVAQPDLSNLQFFLLNTKEKRSTSPLVKGFLNKCQDENYTRQLEEKLHPANEQAIHAWLEGNEKILWEAFTKISDLEASYFSDMIPGYLQTVWEQGLEGNVFRLKLCGAGGGGFMLGITVNRENCEMALGDWELIFI